MWITLTKEHTICCVYGCDKEPWPADEVFKVVLFAAIPRDSLAITSQSREELDMIRTDRAPDHVHPHTSGSDDGSDDPHEPERDRQRSTQEEDDAPTYSDIPTLPLSPRMALGVANTLKGENEHQY